MPRICWQTICICGEPQSYGKALKQLGFCLVRRTFFELLVPGPSTLQAPSIPGPVRASHKTALKDVC
jgi:hypothetical protein